MPERGSSHFPWPTPGKSVTVAVCAARLWCVIAINARNPQLMLEATGTLHCWLQTHCPFTTCLVWRSIASWLPNTWRCRRSVGRDSFDHRVCTLCVVRIQARWVMDLQGAQRPTHMGTCLWLVWGIDGSAWPDLCCASCVILAQRVFSVPAFDTWLSGLQKERVRHLAACVEWCPADGCAAARRGCQHRGSCCALLKVAAQGDTGLRAFYDAMQYA